MPYIYIERSSVILCVIPGALFMQPYVQRSLYGIESQSTPLPKAKENNESNDGGVKKKEKAKTRGGDRPGPGPHCSSPANICNSILYRMIVEHHSSLATWCCESMTSSHKFIICWGSMLRGIPDQAEKKRVHSRAYHTALTQAIHQGLPEEPRLFPNSMFIEVLFVYREILYRSVVPHICTAIQVPTDFVQRWRGMRADRLRVI